MRTPASSESSKIDIVFDLDWTLVKQVDEMGSDPSRYLEVNGEFYRIGDGAIELLESMFSRDRVRVSFFSGGKLERNTSLLKKIETKFGSAFDNAYKVLSFRDLLRVSSDEGLSFAEKLKKDISLINTDLSKVLLIDDDKRFIISNKYLKNLLWLGETYKHYDHFSGVIDPSDIYAPPSAAKWSFDRS